jgi:hypothetical protein
MGIFNDNTDTYNASATDEMNYEIVTSVWATCHPLFQQHQRTSAFGTFHL